ncbi:PREDICTED: uncharacterized protein LOC107327790 [Acropora digitifera]|uniref:uncharacterized protein LOC107327790 n=1 Tax=Acropora digitifera TaxID=70779 RepID=UPI00077ADFF2|nr:PREDICTED: uncharacterized protein LOC107327790 [Acropora digitifera]
MRVSVMEYLNLILKTQSIVGAVRFILSVIAFPTLIAFLASFVDKDRLAFNCHPKPNEVAKQGCYSRYTDDTSALLTPLTFTIITFCILVIFWSVIILYSVKCLRDITEEATESGRESRRHKFWQRFLCHVFIEALSLVAVMGLFCHSQTFYLPEVYSCPQRTSSTTSSAQKENLTCSDLYYKQKSALNIGIIVVMSVILFLCIVTFGHAVWKKNYFMDQLVDRDSNGEGTSNENLEQANAQKTKEGQREGLHQN